MKTSDPDLATDDRVVPSLQHAQCISCDPQSCPPPPPPPPPPPSSLETRHVALCAVGSRQHGGLSTQQVGLCRVACPAGNGDTRHGATQGWGRGGGGGVCMYIYISRIVLNCFACRRAERLPVAWSVAVCNRALSSVNTTSSAGCHSVCVCACVGKGTDDESGGTGSSFPSAAYD